MCSKPQAKSANITVVPNEKKQR